MSVMGKIPVYDLFSVSDIPDLTGKVALVTGTNSPEGVGYHTAFQLAGSNATASAPPFVVDLDDLKAVQLAAIMLASKLTKLDILIHNAGLLARPLDFNSQGISVSFTTNHLAPFVLTATLLPPLKRTADSYPGVRVVSVSSTTHALPTTGIKFDSPASFNAELGAKNDMQSNLASYGMSKLANTLFAKQLQKNFEAEGIQAVAISLHPGNIRTDGAIKFVGRENVAAVLDGRNDVLTPSQGAITSLFAATSPNVWAAKAEYGGAYLIPFGKIQTPSENGQNAELAKQLWETSERVVEYVLAS